MTKMIVPPVKFAPELHSTKAIDALKAAGATRGELHLVPIENIRVMDGLNVRVRETDDYQAHIQHLAALIFANGYDNAKPLAGFSVEENGDKVIYLRDGHTRLEAIKTIVNPALGDTPIEKLPVVVSPQTDMADLFVSLVQSNSGKDLTPFEKGLVVKRLMGLNMDKKQIATRLGYTPRYIDDLLVIVGAPAKVRDLILTGAVTSTNALKTLRKDPAKAAEVLTAAVAKAQARGKAVAAPKDSAPKMERKSFEVSLATGDTMGAVLKAIAAQIRGIVAHDKGEGDQLQTDGQITVTINVPVVEAEKPAKADKPKRTAKAAAPAAEPAPAAEATPPETTPTPGEGADSGGQTETTVGDADLSDL